jgi:hypothetical protein
VSIAKGESFEVEGGIFGEIRTVKKGARIRMSWRELEWDKGTTVQLQIYKKRAKNKDQDKCMIVIQHDGLRSARQKAEMRVYWREIIDQMAVEIEAETQRV